MSSARSRIVTRPRPPLARDVVGREADAVVADRQHEPAALVLQADDDAASAGVARDVGERLLRDAIEVQLLLVVEQTRPSRWSRARAPGGGVA